MSKDNIDYMTMAVSTLDSANKLTSALAINPHYRELGSAGIFAVIMKARSIKIDPFDALNGMLYYVKGKVGMSGELMSMLIRRAGHSVTRDPKSTATNCILHGKRVDNGDTWTSSFSIEEAKTAGIYGDKSPWKSYPDVMCYNRALAKLFRQLFSDLSRGAGYTHDELVEIAHRKSQELPEATKIEAAEFEEAQVVEPPKAQVKVVGISQQEAEEIAELLEQVKKDYKDKLWSYLSLKKINSLDQMTPKEYVKIKTSLIKQIREEAISEAKESSEEEQKEETYAQLAEAV